jgi:hypothetical protein
MVTKSKLEFTSFDGRYLTRGERISDDDKLEVTNEVRRVYPGARRGWTLAGAWPRASSDRWWLAATGG